MWIVLGVVLLIFAIPYVVGLFLPNHYEATVKITLTRDAPSIWARIINHEEHPLSGGAAPKFVTLVDPEQHPAWIEEVPGSSMEVRTVESKAPTHMVLATKNSQFAVITRWQIDLDSEGDQTTVQIEYELTIESSSWNTPFYRFVRSVVGADKQAPTLYLQSIATALGSSAVVEVVEQ